MVNLEKAEKRMKFYNISIWVMYAFDVVFTVMALLHPDKWIGSMVVANSSLIVALCFNESKRQLKDEVMVDILAGLNSRINSLEKKVEEKE